MKDLAAALGVSDSLVSRYAKRGMPVDSVERAERWYRRNVRPRVTTRPTASAQPVAPGHGGGVGQSGGRGNPPADDARPHPMSLMDQVDQMDQVDHGSDMGPADAAIAPEPGPRKESPASSGPSDVGSALADNGLYLEARARQMQADARTSELKLAELEGQLVRRDQIISALAAAMAPMREAALQVGARLAPVLAVQSDPARVQSILEVEMHRVLITPIDAMAGKLAAPPAAGQGLQADLLGEPAQEVPAA